MAFVTGGSAAIKGVNAGRFAIGPEADLFDPCLRILQPRLALRAKGIAAGIEPDRFIEAGIARFEARDNGFKLLQRILE